MVVFLIFGTVVGSGFSSGKEIMVFFSRFGVLSYLYILLAGILFFLLFYFFLNCGGKVLKHLENSKGMNLLIVFISLVFCSSMFAGIKNLFFYFPSWIYYLLQFFLIVCCIFVTMRGYKGLEKVNLFLMPITSILFLIVLVYGLTLSSDFSFQTNSWAGFLYSPLYVGLNTCMSGVIISNAGKGLSKKQTIYASLFSTVLLLIFLFLGNTVILQNGESIFSEMPFLSLASKNVFMFALCYFVILVGCFTTLISLCITLKSSFDKKVSKGIYSTLLAVFIPFLISSLGFSQIVSNLYPIASVLGIFILVWLLTAEVRFRNE